LIFPRTSCILCGMAFETGITSNVRCGNPEQTLDAIKSAGFENVMLEEKTGALCDLIPAAFGVGLKVPYVHLCYKDNFSLWTDDKRQPDCLERIKAGIKICGQNGINTVVLHPTSRKTDPSDIGLGCMEQILECAENYDVRVALENAGRGHIAHLKYLFNRFGPRDLGFCFDSGHWYADHPEFNYLEKFGNRLLAIHLHDNLGGCDDMHLLPFDGMINFDRVAKGIAKSAYRGPVMLEARKNDNARSRYLDISGEEFLHEAHARATKLSKMITAYSPLTCDNQIS